MDNENGFFTEESTPKQRNITHTQDFVFNSSTKCIYCESAFLDQELDKVFGLACCTQCRYTNIKFVTKTTATKHYLLCENDLKNLKFISRPNPHKGNWHDMCLDLKRKTFVDKEEKKKHVHEFVGSSNIKKCKECGMEIEQENI
ncbi:hypothetical protein P3W45_000340 [Vairimorpha bombi]